MGLHVMRSLVMHDAYLAARVSLSFDGEVVVHCVHNVIIEKRVIRGVHIGCCARIHRRCRAGQFRYPWRVHVVVEHKHSQLSINYHQPGGAIMTGGQAFNGDSHRCIGDNGEAVTNHANVPLLF